MAFCIRNQIQTRLETGLETELETELETSWKLNQYLTPCPVYVRAKETAPGRTPAQPPGSLDMVGAWSALGPHLVDTWSALAARLLRICFALCFGVAWQVCPHLVRTWSSGLTRSACPWRLVRICSASRGTLVQSGHWSKFRVAPEDVARTVCPWSGGISEKVVLRF